MMERSYIPPMTDEREGLYIMLVENGTRWSTKLPIEMVEDEPVLRSALPDMVLRAHQEANV